MFDLQDNLMIVSLCVFQCNAFTDFSDIDTFDTTNTTGRLSGKAVCCNQAGASTQKFQLFTNRKQATISFYVKTCTGCHGVLFSYTVKRAFVLDYNGQLSILYGRKNNYDTGIELEDNVWYQLVMTYTRKGRDLILYVFNEERGKNPQIYRVERLAGSNPFENNGDLSLGKFQISEEDPAWKKTDTFVGCFDSLGFVDL